jgi:hypothetical protein
VRLLSAGGAYPAIGLTPARRGPLGALALAALTLLAAAPGAGAAGGEHAVNAQTLLRGGSGGTFPKESWPLFLGQATEAGVQAARFEALWNWAEAKRPEGAGHTYEWARQDEVVTALARAGMRWKVVLAFLPAWAYGPGGGFAPEYHDDFAAFAAAVVRRYGPGGAFWAEHPELPALPTTEYSVWTEPNSANYWSPTQDAAEYERVYRQVRAAMKAVDPGAQVLVSLGWQDFDGYLRRMRAAAGPAWAIDGVAFNPYAPTPLGIAALVRTLRATLRDVGSPDVPIHAWEVGWPRVPRGPGAAHAWDGRIADEPRAASLALASDGLLHSDCGVRDVAVYSLVEKQVDPDAWEQWFGLFNADGSPTATMRAWGASIARFRSEEAKPVLPLCGDAGGPATTGRLLPLTLAAAISSPGCLRASVAYHDYPSEDVSLGYVTAAGSEGGVTTDTTGTVSFCIPEAERQSTFTLRGMMPRLAATPALRCSPSGCVRDAAADCTRPRVVVTPRARRRRGRVRLRVALRCDSSSLSGRRLRVYGVAGAGRRRLLRTVRTRAGYVRMTVRTRRPFTSALVIRFEGVRRLGLAATQARVRLR